jgi:hypothetical protein
VNTCACSADSFNYTWTCGITNTYQVELPKLGEEVQNKSQVVARFCRLKIKIEFMSAQFDRLPNGDRLPGWLHALHS